MKFACIRIKSNSALLVRGSHRTEREGCSLYGSRGAEKMIAEGVP